MFQPRVAIHECASTTLTIDDFSQVTEDYREILFSPPSNTKIIFDFGLFPRGTFATPNWFNDDVLCYLWFRVVDRDRITIKYKASILGEDGQKCYTQEYRWNYNKHKRIGHHFAKFISREELLDPANGYLQNDMLKVFCEVQIIDEQSQVLPVIAANQFAIQLASQHQISQDFLDLLESGKFADVVLVVEGREFLCHKIILSARSPVFAAMFEHETREKVENRVDINDVPHEVFEELLKYIYTDRTESLDRFAFELFSAADKYQLESLKQICQDQLCSILTPDSVSSLLLLADMHQCDQLKDKCVEYIAENARDVVITDGWAKMTTIRPELAVQLFRYLAFKN